MVNNEIRTAFGKNVRRRREELNLSQEALSLLAKVHRTYLSGIENGDRNPTLDVVDRLARALKTRPAMLLNPGSSE